jgi:hypothetical protein
MMGWYGVVPYALQLLYFFQNREREILCAGISHRRELAVLHWLGLSKNRVRDIACWDFSQERAGSATLARALKKIE